MSLRKQVSDSQEQMNFDLMEEDLKALNDFYSDEDEEFLSLLEQVLTEVFVETPDEESFQYLEGNSIYDLSDEKDISNREKFEALALNEGSPEVDDLEALETLSRAYFTNPDSYPLMEDDFQPNHVTGFIQIYSGERFDANGAMVEQWKSINKKVIVRVTDLMEPNVVISIIEEQGIKWGPVFRIVFYGSPLVDLVGSRFYGYKESRELMPLAEAHKNILLALPDYQETEENSESIYDWMDREFQEGIMYGLLPDVSRVTSGHFEMTAIRIQEVFEEELEEKSLSRIMKKETLSVARQNQFIETYSEARKLIKGLNGGEIGQDVLYSLDLKILDDVMFLCARSFERIDDPLTYAHVKAVVTKMNVLKLQKESSAALKTIQRINSGLAVELHLIPSKEVEAIFQILWGNSGIRINTEQKDIYYSLKERLRVIRSAQSRSRK